MGRRQLTQLEIGEAHLVFGDNLAFESVYLVEGVAWPNWIARLGAWLSRTSPPANNAITLCNIIHFPLTLRTESTQPSHDFLMDMCWLIHELTHAWQFQHDGLIYLFQALWVQIKLGPECYNYGGEQGLIDAREQDIGFRDFNREQQGDITKDYYSRHKQGLDTSAWEPFIEELKNY